MRDGSASTSTRSPPCGRGEADAASLLAYYGVPLLGATHDGFVPLESDDQVVAVAQQQIDGRDGVEISRLTASYLVTDGQVGRRISVLAVHSG